MQQHQHREMLLNGWKEISQYLKRGVRTVQRWEVQLGLPIHRPHGRSRSAVLAFGKELDEWLARTPTAAMSIGNGDREANQPLREAMQVLVVEDSVNDLNTCVGVLDKLGVAQVDAVCSISGALLRLEQIVAGKLPKPDVIVLDLNFAVESGFEILRYRKAHPVLKDVEIIVWTIMPPTTRELSALFGIQRVVPKYAGPRELEAAFADLIFNTEKEELRKPS
jgi:CheY-like chemotaxis protein